MKKLLSIIMCAAFAFAMASCSKNNDNNQVELSESKVVTSLTREDVSVGIIKGSGKYSAKIDSPSIADVSIKTTDGKQSLSIHAKENGKAVIVVIDLKTGYQAKCYLSVGDDSFYHTVSDVDSACDSEV